MGGHVIERPAADLPRVETRERAIDAHCDDGHTFGNGTVCWSSSSIGRPGSDGEAWENSNESSPPSAGSGSLTSTSSADAAGADHASVHQAEPGVMPSAARPSVPGNASAASGLRSASSTASRR